MTKPHRSTPEHWATVERYAQQVSSTDDCLLELRSRVEALEAAQHAVASSPVNRINLGLGAEDTATCPHVEEPTAPPASSLVERVADAICVTADCGDTSLNWKSEARAAIREVAAWLRDRNGYPWAWVAQILELEADR